MHVAPSPPAPLPSVHKRVFEATGLVSFKEMYSVDPKKAALLCCRSNKLATHHFGTIKELVGVGQRAFCVLHGSYECAESLKKERWGS